MSALPPTTPPGHGSFGSPSDDSLEARTTLAKARLAEGRADEKEMQNELRGGRLIRRDQAIAVISTLAGSVRAALRRMPEELTEGMEPEVAEWWRRKVDDYLAKRVRVLFEDAMSSARTLQDPNNSKNATKTAVADGGTSGVLRD